MDSYPSLLCTINDEGFVQKPQTLSEYGKLRDKVIQSGWATLSESEFVAKVCHEGYAFYGCVFNGHDLMELGSQRQCWRLQTLIGLDFDNCPVSAGEMAAEYGEHLGLYPWLVYYTFSGAGVDRGHCYNNFRMLWRVEADLNVTYKQWHNVIKRLGRITINPYTMEPYADTKAMDCSRLWQGTRGGEYYWRGTTDAASTIKGYKWWDENLPLLVKPARW